MIFERAQAWPEYVMFDEAVTAMRRKVNEALSSLPIFPCRGDDKRPLTKRGFLDAKFGSGSNGWPLVGVATGEGSGLDCLDIDEGGAGWYDQNFDALPLTRAHETGRKGVHLLFKHAEGLRCSTGRIAPGVDVRADGGYIIWWPREGLPFEDWPLCEWPEWLLKAAMAPRTGSSRVHRQSVGMGHVRSVVGVDGLQATGMGSDAVQRSTIDPLACAPCLNLPAELPATEPTRNLKPRLDCIQRTVERAQRGNRNACLFWAACRYAEIIAEGKLKPWVAMSLLVSAAMTNGLLKEDGRATCKATVLSGFRTVEMRALGAEGGGEDERKSKDRKDNR
jgi:hypothetical protein